MRKIIVLLLTVALSVSFTACSNGGKTDKNTTQSASIPETVTESNTAQTTSSLTEKQDKTTMNIKINNKDFTAEFYDNETAKAFSDMLPLTLNMSELHGNEKYYYFDKSLPSAPSNVEKINAGDIMLYGNDCLVLFYESFSTSYSYTPIGHIDDPAGLATALGNGSVQVTFKSFT